MTLFLDYNLVPKKSIGAFKSHITFKQVLNNWKEDSPSDDSEEKRESLLSPSVSLRTGTGVEGDDILNVSKKQLLKNKM
ncbi:hypothetical protein JTB14_031919 [Gonioctena quinquepunctata]|nr:hypothetical protein JTB14_031919 [Gonioctena quinquepunctata]